MTDHANADAPEELNILVTVEENAQSRLHDIADALRASGMRNTEIFSLGGVVAGSAKIFDLARLKQVPGVASVEVDQTFTAGL